MFLLILFKGVFLFVGMFNFGIDSLIFIGSMLNYFLSKLFFLFGMGGI